MITNTLAITTLLINHPPIIIIVLIPITIPITTIISSTVTTTITDATVTTRATQ